MNTRRLELLTALGVALTFSNCSNNNDSNELRPPTSEIVISEIMYHPVKEDSADDDHEFVEIFNSGSEDKSVAGYKLHIGKTDRLTIPSGTTIRAGGYLVLAKNRDRLLAVTQYDIDPNVVIGDFKGGLDNGGGSVSLLNSKGKVLDQVDYEDGEPWPVGADAFGAKEEWLPALGSYDTHQYRGRSLERYSAKLPSNDPRNWEASPVDGATPGKANTVSGEPPAIVLSTSAVTAKKGSTTILESDKVRVTVNLSAGTVSDVVLEYRLDPVDQIGTTTTTIPMSLKKGSTTDYEATIPATAANTVVRYRITGVKNGTSGTIGPRPTDPREFYAYFVSPPKATGLSYHLFIDRNRWTTLWSNISSGRSSGCNINQAWDSTVPAVFVYDGHVYDVQVRYQGSNYRRSDGIDLRNFSAPGPSQPMPMKVLSWRVKFPSYDEFDGLDGINLNKLKQACPGVLNALEGALMADAGIPAQTFRFARLYINGGYYSYIMEARNISDAALEAFDGDDGNTGDLFKADGVTDPDGGRNVGPWGIGNFSPLGDACSLTAADRYALTYERQNHSYKSLSPEGHAELIGLIEELARIKTNADNDPTVRDYFTKNYDVSQLMTQFALRNWAGVWDDGVHNYLPYKRSNNGKWAVFPHDFDCDFGGDPVDCGDTGKYYNEPTLSFFHPAAGNGETAGAPSELKVQLIRAYRAEFAEKVSELAKNLFSEKHINQRLGEVLDGFDRTAWEESPARYCDLDQRIDEAKTWLAARRSFFNTGVK
jgi:CotH kinase protein/Lamin Tail Domain